MVQNNAFTPKSVTARNVGVRPSMAPLVGLVDTSDPAFPHVAKMLEEMRSAGIHLDEATVVIAIKLGEQRHSRDVAAATGRAATAAAMATTYSSHRQSPIVYYIRRGDVIKIGTTTNPRSRFKNLMPDEILAFESGGRKEEAARHEQFGSCRVTMKGEYFHPAEKLMEHIAALREQNGPPDAMWPTVATMGLGYERTKKKIALPELQTQDALTVTNAARVLGVSRDAIYGWVRRGLIAPVDRGARGCAMYPVEHMRFLAERNRPWIEGNQKRVRRKSQT